MLLSEFSSNFFVDSIAYFEYIQINTVNIMDSDNQT
jgi:hypothetical protein